MEGTKGVGRKEAAGNGGAHSVLLAAVQMVDRRAGFRREKRPTQRSCQVGLLVRLGQLWPANK